MTSNTPPPAPLSAKEEKEKIKELFPSKMKDGQDWCVIDFKWYLMWQQFVDFDGDGEGDGQRPGSMDNASLLEDPSDTSRLKQELRENYDYALIPKTAYDKFAQWYGAEPKIIRQVVSTGGQNARVDLYPMRIFWKKHGATAGANPTTVASISKSAKVRDLKFKLSQRVSMPPHKIRLWAVDEHTKKLLLLEDDTKLLVDCMIEDGDHFVVETKNNDDKWPLDQDPENVDMDRPRQTTTYVPRPQRSADDTEVPVGTVTYSSANPTNQAIRSAAAAAAVGASYGRTGGGMSTLMGMSYRERYKNTEGETAGPGLCGLNNLGNTCFMNSALQCLSNTVPLTNYFLTNEFVKDVNRTNPLGMKGLLADHYSILLKQLWSGKFSVVAPVIFKYMLGKFAPQFSGYQQHDSQELLAFLLDGLHEDLNKVLQKPYVETVESNGRPDEVVAAEAWEAHLKRNKSVIVELFQGQFKSTVICPNCNKVSITYDPFMYLSVPLPISNDTVLLVSCIYLERPPVKYALKLPKNGIITDIKKAMAEVTGLGIEQMGICDIYNHKIFKILPESHPIKLIKENDETFCFEIVANEDRLPPEKREIRQQERKAAKLARKAARGEKAPEPMETDEPKSSAEPADVEMQDKPGDSTEKGEADKEAEEKNEKETEKEKEKEKEKETEKQKEKGKQKKKDKPYLKYMSVLHRELKPNPMRKSRKYELFGFPFVLSIDPAFETNRQIYERIWHHVQRIYKKDEEVPTEPEDPQAAQEKLEKIEQMIKEKELSEEEIRGLKGVGHYPFTIFLGTNTYSATPMKEVPLNDEIHGSLGEASKFHFCLDWTDEGVAKYYNKAKFAAHESVALLKQEENKAIPLGQCLELFTKKEKLSAEDAWYCSTCQEHREASKKFDIWKLPKVLVVHLKRFQFTKYWRDKIETLVDFPEELDMTSYVSVVDPDCPPIYSLNAVSNHSGTMGFGHYTAYAKNRKDGKWYHFNDSSVTQASSKEIVSPSAYVLFYVRKDVENVPYAPFEYSQQEVEEFMKKSQEEIDAEREKEREKEQERYARAGTTSSRAGRPSSLDDIDMYGPHLPGKGKELAIVPAGDPMDTDSMHTASTAGGVAGYPAGYDPTEKEYGPLAGDPVVGLRARRHVPGPGAGTAAVAAAVGNHPNNNVPGDPASVFAAATAGLIHVPGANLNQPGAGNAAPMPGYPYPRGPLDPADPTDMQHDKRD